MNENLAETTELKGTVTRISFDNAEDVLYLMLGVSPKRHVLRIRPSLVQGIRAELNLTKPGDQVRVLVTETGFIAEFNNFSMGGF